MSLRLLTLPASGHLHRGEHVAGIRSPVTDLVQLVEALVDLITGQPHPLGAGLSTKHSQLGLGTLGQVPSIGVQREVCVGITDQSHRDDSANRRRDGRQTRRSTVSLVLSVCTVYDSSTSSLS